MTSESLQSLMAAFYGVFPHGFALTFPENGDMILIGTRQPITFDTARIDAILAQPAVAAVLNWQNIRSHRDLLRFFSLSRGEALEASDGVIANSDINLFTEVRLAALTGTIRSDDDPYRLIARHAAFDIRPYLRGDKAVARATQYDGMLERRLVDKAAALYNAHERWPARIHLQQAVILMESGDEEKARQTLRRIIDPIVRADAMAEYLRHWTRVRETTPPPHARN